MSGRGRWQNYARSSFSISPRLPSLPLSHAFSLLAATSNTFRQRPGRLQAGKHSQRWLVTRGPRWRTANVETQVAERERERDASCGFSDQRTMPAARVQMRHQSFYSEPDKLHLPSVTPSLSFSPSLTGNNNGRNSLGENLYALSARHWAGRRRGDSDSRRIAKHAAHPEWPNAINKTVGDEAILHRHSAVSPRGSRDSLENGAERSGVGAWRIGERGTHRSYFMVNVQPPRQCRPTPAHAAALLTQGKRGR